MGPKKYPGGAFKYALFPPLPEEKIIQFDEHIFQMGSTTNKPVIPTPKTPQKSTNMDGL